jgi:hypothetical protein
MSKKRVDDLRLISRFCLISCINSKVASIANFFRRPPI